MKYFSLRSLKTLALRSVVTFIGSAALALSLSGCTDETEPPDLDGQDVHLTIVHTSDLHSRFFPYYFAPGQIDKGLGLAPKAGQTTAVVGGISRVSTVVKCIRGFYSGPSCYGITEQDPSDPNAGEPIAGPPAQRSLHLDSGDIFEGAPVFNQFNGEVEMRAMSEIGLSAMALGNHEFDKGSVNLAQQMQAFGGFPIMAANYMFGDPTDPTQPKLDLLIHPYTIFNVGGLVVGVIGMGNLSSIQGIIEGGNSLGVTPIEATQAMADTVRVVRPQVDMLFVTSHLGLDEDEGVAASAAESTDQNQAIAQQGVDVIFGGHLHIVLNPPKDIEHFDTNGTLAGHTVLCHSGAFAKYVGRLDLVIHMPSALERTTTPDIRPAVKSYTYKIIPIEDNIKNDPVMDNMLEPYLFKMNQYLNLTQVYSVVACPINSSTCPKIARTDPNGGDSQLGNLVAASMRLREEVAADIGVTNSLGIRADFESGPLTLEEMYNVFPFDNTLTVMYLSGGEVQEMFDEESARAADRACATQAQVSGVYYDMVCTFDDADCNARQANAGVPNGPCAKNIYLGDGCRMPDGTFNGTMCNPLNPFGYYKVAVNDYIAQGGSGFDVLKRNTTKSNTGISLRDALVDYIRGLPNRCDPTKYTNIVGVTCKDSLGETFDCSSTCACRDANSNVIADTTCDAFAKCAIGGVQCIGTDGNPYDCSADCCGHDDRSGPSTCSPIVMQFKACAAMGLKPQLIALSPQPYDYRDAACLDDCSVQDDTDADHKKHCQTVQIHDGRIQGVTTSGTSQQGNN